MDDKADDKEYPASRQGDVIEITEEAIWAGWESLRFSQNEVLSLEAYKAAVSATFSALKVRFRFSCRSVSPPLREGIPRH